MRDEAVRMAAQRSCAQRGSSFDEGRLLELLHQIEQHLAAIRDGLTHAPSRWLTVEEAAEELRVSRDTIERLIASGRVKATQITTPSNRGHRYRYRIRRDWLDQFGSANLRPPSPSLNRRGRRESRPSVDFIG